MELKNKGLTIRETAKKLNISKTTVVKYLKIFNQGSNPSEISIKFKKKKKSKSYNRQISEKKYCYENYLKPLEQQNKKLAMDNMNLKEERDQYKNQLNVKKEEIERYQRVDIEKDNRIITLEKEIEEIKEEQNNNINQLTMKEENIRYTQVDINKDNRMITPDENIFLKQTLQEHIDENNNLKMKNTHLKEKEGEYIEQLKDKNIEINGLKQQIQNINADSKHKDFLRRQEEYNQHYNFLNREIKKIKTTLDHPFNINDLKHLIELLVKIKFRKSNPSKFNETQQEKSNVTKSLEDQNFEKKNKPNLEFKKSIDNQSYSGIDFPYIFVKSVIEIYKNFQNSQKNSNQIVIIK